MIYTIFGVIIISSIIFIVWSIYDFKRKKKKYLPLEAKLTREQNDYVLTNLEMQRSYQSVGNSDITYLDINDVIDMVKYGQLDEKSLKCLNEYMSNLTLNIGFFKIK
jgi:hypothetical protein